MDKRQQYRICEIAVQNVLVTMRTLYNGDFNEWNDEFARSIYTQLLIIYSSICEKEQNHD